VLGKVNNLLSRELVEVAWRVVQGKVVAWAGQLVGRGGVGFSFSLTK
jgi:hypothetical protein